MLERNFVTDTISELNDPKVAVVFGNRRETNPRASIYNRLCDRDWIAPVGPTDSVVATPSFGATCSNAWRLRRAIDRR